MMVIADDITGAAEIAGAVFTRGLPVRLCCGGAACDNVAADSHLVVATDTRSMTEREAVAETLRIVSHLSPLSSHLSPLSSHLSPLTSPLFKKTDSALRGHVVAELSALMDAAGYRRAVFLPANPSKGRVIRGGVYYINNVRIAETDFRFDPEFPALTSSLRERFPDAADHNIVMPDAESLDDIRRVVEEYHDGTTLFAGAADLFDAFCSVVGLHGRQGMSKSSEPSDGPVLMLCGSTQSRPPDIGIPVAPMPREIYDGSNDLSLWDTSAYAKERGIILSIPYSHLTGREVAVRLRAVMAAKARALIAVRRPARLVIEGGATAWATLKAVGWHDFTVTAQPAAGVVELRADNGTLVTLKPGSYPWHPAVP